MTRRLIDPDRQREQRRQSIMLDRLEARYRPAFTREIARAMRDMVQGYELTGEVPPARNHYDQIEATFQSMAAASAVTFGGRVIEQGVQKGLAYTLDGAGVTFAGRAYAPRFEGKEGFATMFRRLALQYVAQEAVRRKITSIADTTRAQIVAKVDAGYRAGLGVSEIAKAISADVPMISRWRGALIARTETHGAANFGAQYAAKETGLTLRKEWVAAQDERTRASHSGLDGDTVGMDDAFGNGLMYPGDPSGDPEEVINCRCAVSHIVVD